MRTLSRTLIALITAALIIAILFLSRYLPLHTPSTILPATAEETLFAAKLPDTAGKIQYLTQWRGNVLVVNFWATWCPPCREEMPELDALQQKYASHGLVVLGIATDDMEKTRAFVAETKVNYPLLVGDASAIDLSTSMGNDRGILPYTLIINRQGKVVSNLFGRINKDALEQMLQTLL